MIHVRFFFSSIHNFKIQPDLISPDVSGVSPEVSAVGNYHQLFFIVEDIFFISFLKIRNAKLIIRK